MKKTSCNGTGRISKVSLLSMMGEKAEPRPFLYGQSLAEDKKSRILGVIEENGGNLNRASAILGIRVSSLKRWIKQWAADAPGPSRSAPTTRTRGFYESIRNPWSVTSFDPSTREVCIEVRTPSSKNLLSYTLPNLKPANY